MIINKYTFLEEIFFVNKLSHHISSNFVFGLYDNLSIFQVTRLKFNPLYEAQAKHAILAKTLIRYNIILTNILGNSWVFQ